MPNSDLEIRDMGGGGGGWGSSRPLDKWGGAGVGLQKIFFWPFRPQFGLKIRGATPPAPSLDLPL